MTSPTDPIQIYNDGVMALREYWKTDDIVTLNESIRLMRMAESSAPSIGEMRLSFLSSLGWALRLRFEVTGRGTDLSEALVAFQTVLDATEGLQRLDAMNELAACLLSQYKVDHERESLEAAIRAFRELLGATASNHPRYSRHLSNLGHALILLFRTGSAPWALDEAIALQDAAVSAAEITTGQEYVRYLTNLATSLQIRSGQWPVQNSANMAIPVSPPSEADESRAIDLYRRAASTAEGEEKAAPLTAAGMSLLNRFRQSANENHLAEAIDSLNNALEVTDRRSRHYRDRLQQTASVLMEFVLTRRAHVDRTMALFTELVKTESESDPEFPDHLVGLGISASVRYENTGALSDLEIAYNALLRAVSVVPDNSPKLSWCLGNLGMTAGYAYEVSNREEFRALAIESLRAAVAANDHDRPSYLVALGIVLQKNIGQKVSQTEKDESLALFREALASASHPRERAAAANGLGHALSDISDKTASLSNLNEAIASFRQAISTMEESWSWPIRFNLAGALWSRFVLAHDVHDKIEALSLIRSLVETDANPPNIRVRAAIRLAQFLMTSVPADPVQAMQTLEIAVALLPRLTWRGMRRRDREHLISDATFYGLGSDAASCAIAAGQPERAVELLEHSRTLLWSQLLETRTDLGKLAELSPELASDLETLRGRMGSEEEDPEVLATLSRSWDRAVMLARELPGMTSFLKPPSFVELQAAAVSGPVVMLVVSEFGCYALAVTDSAVQVIPLPLTWWRSFDLGYAFHRAVERFAGGHQRVSEFRQLQEEIREGLSMLWDEVTGPVLNALGYYKPPPPGQPWPRVWWCPTGLLTLTPLHAAQPHRSGHVSQIQKGALDCVLSSYTISLRVLIDSRARNPIVESAPATLLVGVPQGPSSRRLKMIRAEISDIERQVRGRRTVLLDQHATADRVLADLPTHTRAHFACHGGTDLLNPTSSGLLLYDRWLSIRDIADIRHDEAELAYLSACETGRGGSSMSDEAMHIAAAMQIAGFRHVIGTLWEIEDRTAGVVAKDFYKQLSNSHCSSSADSAEALHEAVRQMRQRKPRSASSWAPYVHYGP